MAFSSRSRVNYISSNRFPTGLRFLLIANIGLFVLRYILRAAHQDIFQNFQLVPAQVVQTFAVWQLVTYLFLHSGISHILWNMLGLWMFGAELERTWGTARFIRFYLICGIAAGLTVTVASYLTGTQNFPTEGSSGAIYAILMAYALVFPDRTLLFGFLIPMKPKYFVMIIGGIVLLQSYSAALGEPGGSGVQVFAHLGGLIVGYLMLRGRGLRMQIRHPIVSSYQSWKLRRAKKKIQVYLRKQDRDRTIH
jgi:membrane associated rhomboid family serine protease